MHDTPYLHVMESPRQMGGKGAVRDTLFGVLGMTTRDPFTRTLGGLVSNTRTSGEPAPKVHKAKGIMTERNIAGKAAKTHIPGQHLGMVPYPGEFLSKVGKMVSS
jgi:hypothetical protein